MAEYTDRQPMLSDAEKLSQFWYGQAQQKTEQAKLKNAEAALAGTRPDLAAAYQALRAERDAQPPAEYKGKPWNGEGLKLPPQHPLVQARKMAAINGAPKAEQSSK